MTSKDLEVMDINNIQCDHPRDKIYPGRLLNNYKVNGIAIPWQDAVCGVCGQKLVLTFNEGELRAA